MGFFNLVTFDYSPYLVGLKRFVKVFAYAGISAVAIEMSHDPLFVVVGPVLAAIEKYLQEKGVI